MIYTRMKDFRSGIVRKKAPLKDFPLKKEDLDVVLINNEGLVFKLEDIMKNSSTMNVVYTVDSKYHRNYETNTSDIIITRADVNKLAHLIDISDFFLKSPYYNEEKAVIFKLIKPKKSPIYCESCIHL